MSELLPPSRPRPALVPTPGSSHRAVSADGDAEPTLQSVDLREMLGVLRRHLGLLAASVVIALGAAAYIVYSTPARYKAQAVIRLSDPRRALTSGLDNSGLGMGSMAGAWTDPILSQIQVLQSRAVAREVVAREFLGLRVHPRGFAARLLDDVKILSDDVADTLFLAFSPTAFTVRGRSGTRPAVYGAPVDADGLRFTVKGPPARQNGMLVVQTESEAIDELVGGLSAEARKYTDVIDVSYTAGDPHEARRVVNATIEVFQLLNAQKAQEESRRRRIFLEEQLQQTDAILARAQDALSEFASRTQVYGTEDRIKAEQTGVMELDIRREELASDRGVYQTLLEALTNSSGAESKRNLRAIVSSPGIASNPVVSQLYTQLVTYETTRDTMVAGPWARAQSNPDVIRIDTLVRTTEQKLTSAVGSHIAALDARLAALDDLKARNAAALQQLPTAQAAEARLRQQVDIASRMATQLREEHQRARMAEAVEAGQVEIIDLAARAGAQISKNAPLKLTMGLLLGLLFGWGAAFVLEHLNTAIRRREDIEAVLQVPGLAVIPQIARRTGKGKRAFGGMRLPRLPGRNGNGRRGAWEGELVTVTDFRSSEAEAYRTLRTNLIFSQAIQTLRTIVVTSPSPQDGKTTTAANLAITFAQQGIRVLLMDCDLRRARLHAVFGLPREPGLTQLVLGQVSDREVLRDTEVEGLTLLTSGTLPPNPSEFLGGRQMQSTLERLAKQFDVIIIDTAPIHVAADAQILGAQVDGVLLVLRAGETERQAAQEAVMRMSTVGARIVGAVLNDPDQKVASYGGYYYYEYYKAET